jgi:hypothetical protein
MNSDHDFVHHHHHHHADGPPVDPFWSHIRQAYLMVSPGPSASLSVLFSILGIQPRDILCTHRNKFFCIQFITIFRLKTQQCQK